jgi:hypothetical protein
MLITRKQKEKLRSKLKKHIPPVEANRSGLRPIFSTKIRPNRAFGIMITARIIEPMLLGNPPLSNTLPT